MSLKEANEMLARMMRDIERVDNERTEHEAKANPEKYRNCRVMERGTGTPFRSYTIRGKTKGNLIGFCYTQNRNVAGFYLTFIECHSGKFGYRTHWHGHRTKQEATAYALARYLDAKKPKDERKWILPPFKQKINDKRKTR